MYALDQMNLAHLKLENKHVRLCLATFESRTSPAGKTKHGRLWLDLSLPYTAPACRNTHGRLHLASCFIPGCREDDADLIRGCAFASRTADGYDRGLRSRLEL